MSIHPSPTSDPPAWSLGDRLRKARTHSGMTQGELAEAIGISARSLGKYENDAPVKRPVLLSWSLATGVPLDWIITGEAPDNGPTDPGGQEGSPSRQITNRIAVVTVLPLQSAEKDAA